MVRKIVFRSDEEAAELLKEYKEKYNVESDIVDRVIEKLSKRSESRH